MWRPATGMRRIAIALSLAVASALSACGTLGEMAASQPVQNSDRPAYAAVADTQESVYGMPTQASPGVPDALPSKPTQSGNDVVAASDTGSQIPVQDKASPPGTPGAGKPTDLAEATITTNLPLVLGPDEIPRPKNAFPTKPVGNLWDRIRAGFAMPELDSRLVKSHERAYLSRPDYLEHMVKRGRKYLFHIVEEVEKRNLPTELALLPFVESAMNPGATSHAKAAGLWQFIPSTGRAFDLRQNWWVDNRRDVVQSTRAALDYLEKIYALNDNDWFLALASYNWGEGAVARARRSNRRAGRADDYTKLRMPRETRNYVPKLIALKNLIARADELGLALPYLPDQPYFVTIEQLRPIDLKLAARFAGMTVDEFVALNPAHNRPLISASRSHHIKLPTDRLNAFLAAIERHESQDRVFASWQPYTLSKHDSLTSVAHRFDISVGELRKANGLSRGSRLLAGSRILAPQTDVKDESRVASFKGAKLVEEVARPARYYKSRHKQSLTRIARRYGVSSAKLRAWNGLGKKVVTLSAGKRILVRPPSRATIVTDERGRRRVVRSRSLKTSKSASHSTGSAAAKARVPNGAEAVRAIRARANGVQAKRASPRM